jgi:hypothetical protein
VFTVWRKDAVEVAAKSQRDTEATKQSVDRAEIVPGRFGDKESGGQDLAAGVVLKAERGEEGGYGQGVSG